MSEDNTQTAFNIPESIDKIDAVPEKFRSLYVEHEGKFVFQTPDSLARALENAKRERNEAKQRAATVDKWERLGKSPDEISELLAAQRKAEEKKAVEAGEWDKLRAQMNDAHAKALGEKDEALAAMQASLEEYLVDSASIKAIAELDGVVDLLLPHVKRHIKVVQDNGKYAARVFNDKGDTRVNAKGEPLTIQDLVAEMRSNEVFGLAFKANTKDGSGAPSRNVASGEKTIPRREFDALSPDEKMARIRSGVTITD